VRAASEAIGVLGALTAVVSPLIVSDTTVFGAFVVVIVAVVCLSGILVGLLDVASVVLAVPLSVFSTRSVFGVPGVLLILVTVVGVPFFSVFPVDVSTFGGTVVPIVPAPSDGGLVVGMTVVLAGSTSVTFVSTVVFGVFFLLLNGFD